MMVTGKKAVTHEAKTFLHHSITEKFDGKLRNNLLTEDVFENLGHAKRGLSLWPLD